MSVAAPVSNTQRPNPFLAARAVAPAPLTPLPPLVPGDTLIRSTTPQPKAPVGTEVPGEKLRTLLSLAAMVMSPLVQVSQTVGMLGKLTFANPFMQQSLKTVLRGVNALGRSPIINNPVTRTSLGVISRVLPFVNLSILCFDGYAAYQTFTNPEASGFRKALVGARLALNAAATALSFIPGSGAVLAMAPAWGSIGVDLYIKHLNAQGKP
jgi:hypothetical protein